MDVIEIVVGECPLQLGIVDFEFKIWWNPLISRISLTVLVC